MATTITATEFQQNVGRFLRESHADSVIITSHGQAANVLCSHARYSEMWNAWMEKKGELVDVSDHAAVKEIQDAENNDT